MKYNVGDKVKIREDLVVGNLYGASSFTSKMEQYKGKTATITNAYYNYTYSYYHIDIDYEHLHWTDEMFEDVPKSKFNVGDKVRVRRDLEINKNYNGLTFYSTMNSKYRDIIMTIEKCADDNYMCKENAYWWGEDMLEKVEENVGMTVEDLLNKTDVEHGGLIITVYYPNAYFEATIGHNKINRNSELYKRFIKAYGDMIVDEVSFDIENDYAVVMRIKVDYAD